MPRAGVLVDVLLGVPGVDMLVGAVGALLGVPGVGMLVGAVGALLGVPGVQLGLLVGALLAHALAWLLFPG